LNVQSHPQNIFSLSGNLHTSILDVDDSPMPSKHKILEGDRWSPSAHNAQPCRFIILTENGRKKRIAKANAEKWNKDLIKNGVPNDEREMLLESSKTISF